MRRVCVVGNSGSGKSTLARALADRLGVPVLELDSVYHQRDWTPLPVAEFTTRVEEFISGDGWVVDGNYRAVQPIVWARADTVIWLDLPRLQVMRQLVARTLHRVVRGEELWNGNRERWRNLFTLDPQESVIAWSWTQHHSYRSRYADAAADPGHLEFVRITSRAQARRLTRR